MCKLNSLKDTAWPLLAEADVKKEKVRLETAFHKWFFLLLQRHILPQ
ncbi:hypothetical protein [Bartonella sp. B1098]|nr:hypothetical protein [Bartonella sp. B1098]